MTIPKIPKFLAREGPPAVKFLTEEERWLWWQMGPLFTRGRRVRHALRGYQKDDSERRARILFWELEAYQEMLLLAIRALEYRPLNGTWDWSHTVLSMLHRKYGFELQIPDHLPVI